MTPSAAARLERGELTGAAIDGPDLARDGDTRNTFYIGGVAGRGPAARAFVMTKLRDLMRTRSQGERVTVYSHPVTPEGLRLTRKHGLLPIPGLPDAIDSLFKVIFDPQTFLAGGSG